MKQKTTAIVRNEAISELCQSRSKNIIWRYMPEIFISILCLFLSIQALAQSSDTAHKDVSRTPSTPVYKTDPIIILDGAVYKGDIKTINSEDIHDITVLKGNDATALYGADAVMGAIVIRTMKNPATFGVPKKNGGKPVKSAPNTGALIILDGVPYKGTIGTINPNNIQDVTILKPSGAVALYGQDGANGAVLVTTKKYKKADTTKKAKQ
ncbi:MAG: TonB-dependent receptor plug domain-containing protein [Mucilaginibacter sp.]